MFWKKLLARFAAFVRTAEKEVKIYTRRERRKKFYAKGFHLGPEFKPLDQYYLVYREKPVPIYEFDKDNFLKPIDSQKGYLIFRDGTFTDGNVYHTIPFYRKLEKQKIVPPLKFAKL